MALQDKTYTKRVVKDSEGTFAEFRWADGSGEHESRMLNDYRADGFEKLMKADGYRRVQVQPCARKGPKTKEYRG